MMHMRGNPTTMVRPEFTAYGDVATEVGIELQAQAEFALAAGIEPWRILLDPGNLTHSSCGIFSTPVLLHSGWGLVRGASCGVRSGCCLPCELLCVNCHA